MTTNAITTTADQLNQKLVIEFGNGKTLTIRPEELSDDIRNAAMFHGLKQKLVDAAAISRNTDTGRSASIEDKYEAVLEVAGRLKAGQWNKSREAGAGKASGGLLFQALTRMYDTKTPEQVRAFLDSKTKEEQEALRKNPRVAAIIATIKAEGASPAVDTANLLAGLED